MQDPQGVVGLGGGDQSTRRRPSSVAPSRTVHGGDIQLSGL